MYEIAIDFSKQALTILAPFPDTAFDKGQCHETLAAACGHLGQHQEAQKWRATAMDELLKAGPTQWRKEVAQDLDRPSESLAQTMPKDKPKKKWWQF